jgi:hypothetical protein
MTFLTGVFIAVGFFFFLFGLTNVTTANIAPTVLAAACFCGILARIAQASSHAASSAVAAPAPSEPQTPEAEVTAKQLDRFAEAFKPSGKWV